MNPNMALKVWAYSQAIFCFAAKKRGHNRSVHVQVMLHAALGRPNFISSAASCLWVIA